MFRRKAIQQSEKHGLKFTAFVIAGILAIGCQKSAEQVDVLIVGGGASGVTAGIQAARMDANALIVEETTWLGGMLTAAGVSAIDGNHSLPAGLWGEFRDSLRLHYGGAEALKTGWVSNTQFEPSVGNRILHAMTANEPNLSVWKESKVDTIIRQENGWKVVIRTPQGLKTVDCKVLIDATELGDVAKECGVGYDIGMESRYATGEEIAPEKANNIIQDLTFVAILKDYGEDRTIPRPEGYDSTRFACSCANDLCVSPPVTPERLWSPNMMLSYGKLPNGKFMINWPFEGNDYYVNLVEMTPQEREEVLKVAKNHTLQFVYYIQKELGMNYLSLADDEYPTTDLLPFIPYHRESRRIHGEVRFDLNDVKDPYSQQDALYRTCIAVGDYPVDHHHKAYKGNEELPDLYFYPIPSYGLPAGCLIPKGVDDLIVAEKSVSVSNLINGTTRLQPVVLQIGQAAGVMAALSVKQNKEIRDLSLRDIQNEILDAGGYLLPYLDREKTDPAFRALQRIGSVGILRGFGRNVQWRNQTWLKADTLLTGTDLIGLKDVYPAISFDLKPEPVKTSELVALISQIAESEKMDGDVSARIKEAAIKHNLDLQPEKPILRGETALLIDEVLDPFNHKPVDMQGRFITP